MRRFVELEVDDDVATQKAVVEDQIDEVVVLIEGEALLAGLEKKAFAEFEEEVLQAVDDGLLQIVFRVASLFLQAEELQHERLFQQILRPDDDLSLLRELADACLVPAERKALVKTGGFLALQLRHRPSSVRGLDLVEAAFVRVFDGEEDEVVGPTEGERAA